jgi:hypothetical protein
VTAVAMHAPKTRTHAGHPFSGSTWRDPCCARLLLQLPACEHRRAHVCASEHHPLILVHHADNVARWPCMHRVCALLCSLGN